MKGQALIDAIVAKATDLTKSRRHFLAHILMLFLSVRHRINFLQLARHTDQYCEHTMRLQFEQFVDFVQINQALIEQHGSRHFLIALDAGYLPKSGKHTPGLGKYWSGCAQKVLPGLEVSLLSVIDPGRRCSRAAKGPAFRCGSNPRQSRTGRERHHQTILH